MSASIHPQPDGTVTIHTPRLLLRAAQPTDAEGLHLCFSDPEVMRYWSTVPHPSLSETQSWISKMTSSTATNGVTDFVIVLLPPSKPPTSPSLPSAPPSSSPSTVIGKIGIFSPLTPSTPSSPHPTSTCSERSGEIGFLLHRAYQRRGLVSEALSALLGYLFERVGVSTIMADVDPRNEASRGTLAKHDFAVTGRAERTWEVGGVWVDSEYWALTRREWESRKGGGRVKERWREL